MARSRVVTSILNSIHFYFLSKGEDLFEFSALQPMCSQKQTLGKVSFLISKLKVSFTRQLAFLDSFCVNYIIVNMFIQLPPEDVL